MDTIKDLSRELLAEMLADFARNWLAHDGLWFLEIEKRQGMETAIECDRDAWRQFSQIEAKRILKRHSIPQNSGLEGLKKALGLRMYAFLNEQEIYEEDEKGFSFRMKACRVQSARHRKGLPDFPCKEVGIVEYEEFARTIDERIRTKCLCCPPDDHPADYFCAWRFELDQFSRFK